MRFPDISLYGFVAAVLFFCFFSFLVTSIMFLQEQKDTIRYFRMCNVQLTEDFDSLGVYECVDKLQSGEKIYEIIPVLRDKYK